MNDADLAPIMDDDDARRMREERIVNWFERPWHILNSYQSRQRSEKALRMSTAAMEFALGYRLAAGADGLAELARKHHISKQAMGKAVNHFIEQLALEPLPFQRKADARANMAEARRRQVQRKD